MDHVEELRATISRLQTENRTLKQRAEQAEKKLATLTNTGPANKARSLKAARLDAIVILELKRQLKLGRGERSTDADLFQFGFPNFFWHRRIRKTVADALNAKGLTAPRGGQWTVRQVHRVFTRYAAGLKQK